MRIGYDYYKYIFVVNKNLRKPVFLKMAGAGRGFSKTFFSDVYDSVLSEAENIESLYDNYYRVEYSSLKDFLVKKYCLKTEWVDKLLTFKCKNEDYTIIAYDSLAYGDGGVDNLIYPDKDDIREIGDKFSRLFLMDIQYENKD